MKTRILLACGAFLSALLCLSAAEKPAPPDVLTELKALVEKTRNKISAGDVSESALAEELNGFDALLAAHRGEKSDAVAQVLLVKASLYLQVLEDYERGTEVLQQLKAGFAGTHSAAQAEAMLVQLEGQKESLKAQAALKVGATFPDFADQDLNGAPLSMGKFRGKVVLVDFWATWCGPCITELPNLQAAYAKYHDKGFEIVGISLDRDEAKLKSFLAEQKMTWPQHFNGKDEKTDLAVKYGVNSIPATYLLDAEGKIVAKNLRGPALEAQLARLLKP